MPAVKMVPIKNEDGQVVAQYFEPSNSFVTSVAKNRLPMVRPDGRQVNVNKKLQARGHYDDKHGFTMPGEATELTPGQLRTAPARAAAAAKREENAK